MGRLKNMRERFASSFNMMLTCRAGMEKQTGKLLFLRAALNSIFCVFWTVFCFFPAALALLVFDRGKLSHLVVRKLWVSVMLRVCGAKVEIRGRENFDRHRPYIFVSNHQSLYDIIALFHATENNLRFVAKKSLYFVPFLGQYLSLAGHIKVDRSNRQQAIRSLEKAGEKIRRGVSVISFPEGTRSADGQVKPFKKGAFMLALQARVPLVPVSVSGSNLVLPKKTLLVFPGRIKVMFAPPIDPAQYGAQRRDELIEKVHQIIVENKSILEREE